MSQPGGMITGDLIVVVPGIMGSELADVATGEILWGMRDPRWYMRVWAGESALKALAITDDERQGKYGRVRPTGLLRFPAFAPVLRGFEPYGRLLGAVREAVAEPTAVAEFAYDWRLPVSHNATQLAEFIAARLAERNVNPRHPGEARAVIIAHSMGGLVARHLMAIAGAAEMIRMVITLGTPFYGAVKAAVLLSSGDGAPLPLPRARLREVARTLPGVYDLLPVYRCVDDGTAARRLTAADVRSIGGDADLATQALDRAAQAAEVPLPGHVQIVGAHQPTLQSLTLDEGIARGHQYTCKPDSAGGIQRIDLAGDGTVYRESAQLPSVVAMALAQSHGAIAKSNEAIIAVVDALADRRTGPWLGAGDIGLDLPDLVTPAVLFDIRVTGASHPLDVSCRIIEVASERMLQVVPMRAADAGVAGQVAVPAAGLYRVEVTGGGASAVSQLLMAGPGTAA